MCRRLPRLVTVVAAGLLVLAAVPAAAQIPFPPTPVGGQFGFGCVHVCFVDQEGDACVVSMTRNGTVDLLSATYPFFVQNLRRGPALSGSNNPCVNGNTNPVTLPVSLNAGQALYFDLFFRPTAPGNHSGLLQLAGRKDGQPVAKDLPLAGTATGGDPTAPCVDGPNTLCLRDDRFKVQMDWRTPSHLPPPNTGAGTVVPFQTDDSGLFWFFNQNNWETVVKVLNGCPVNNRFWVFAGGLTNVETVITVTDTQSGDVKQYRNPLNTPFQPIQDTNAFATCP